MINFRFYGKIDDMNIQYKPEFIGFLGMLR